MGYRDDFYVVENVIGYSGNLNQFPSVYFESNSEFGHITQQHGSSQNVGRGKVASNEGYSIGNVITDGELKLVEAMGGQPFHVSRSILKRVGDMSGGDKAILFQAIWKYPNEKYISEFSEEDFDLIEQTEGHQARLMTELLSKRPRQG